VQNEGRVRPLKQIQNKNENENKDNNENISVKLPILFMERKAEVFLCNQLVCGVKILNKSDLFIFVQIMAVTKINIKSMPNV